ncbi:hypothetical protein [Actinomadura physcomitrii]|nr:hypothetical protein [Actinomadura physcomitrii]
MTPSTALAEDERPTALRPRAHAERTAAAPAHSARREPGARP